MRPGLAKKKTFSVLQLKESNAVFGRSLNDLLVQQGDEIPHIVLDCVNWLEKNGKSALALKCTD
jgi:hypothetical protein